MQRQKGNTVTHLKPAAAATARLAKRKRGKKTSEESTENDLLEITNAVTGPVARERPLRAASQRGRWAAADEENISEDEDSQEDNWSD